MPEANTQNGSGTQQADDTTQQGGGNGQSQQDTQSQDQGTGTGNGGNESSWLDQLPPEAAAEIRKLRGESARYRNERNEFKTKADKYEQEQMTAQERAEAQAREAQERADAAEARAMRLEVAGIKGLTPSQAKRLQGSTREELEADADDLLTEFGGSQGDGDSDRQRQGGRRDWGQGARGTRGGAGSDPKAQINAAIRSKLSGV